MTEVKNFKRRDKVYCYKNNKYVKGVIQEIGQDEKDRWGDVSYWVKLVGDTNKYYVVYTPAEYIKILDKNIIRYEDDIYSLKLEIKTLNKEIEITNKLKEEFYNEN